MLLEQRAEGVDVQCVERVNLRLAGLAVDGRRPQRLADDLHKKWVCSGVVLSLTSSLVRQTRCSDRALKRVRVCV